MQNATWEDWERWRERENGGEQDGDSRTVYMSNAGFTALIFAFVSVGGVVQGVRANNSSTAAMERRDQVHKEASLEYNRTKRATMTTGDRNERIQSFLEHRNANLGGEPSYVRLLPPAENCAPDSVRKQ